MVSGGAHGSPPPYLPPLQRGKWPRIYPGSMGAFPVDVGTALPAVRGWRRANPTRRAGRAPTSPSEEGEEEHCRIAAG